MVIDFIITGGLASAYRLRGWGEFLNGTFSRRLFWAATVGACVFLLNYSVAQSVYSAIGAFLSMALIAHGKYYTVQNIQQAAMMGLIGGARMMATTLPLASIVSLSGDAVNINIKLFCFTATALNVVLTPLAYFTGTRISDKLKVDSMWFAEPFAGAAYAICLIVTAGEYR